MQARLEWSFQPRLSVTRKAGDAAEQQREDDQAGRRVSSICGCQGKRTAAWSPRQEQLAGREEPGSHEAITENWLVAKLPKLDSILQYSCLSLPENLEYRCALPHPVRDKQ